VTAVTERNEVILSDVAKGHSVDRPNGRARHRFWLSDDETRLSLVAKLWAGSVLELSANGGLRSDPEAITKIFDAGERQEL